MEVEDVAAIVAVRNGCWYGDGDGEGRGKVGQGMRFGFEEVFVEEEDWKGGGNGREDEREEVLVFEFLDGELKGESQGNAAGTGRVRMPVFGQAQMMKLIERRNGWFRQSLERFVARCVEQGLDPDDVLREERVKFIPRPAETHREGERKLTAELPASIPRERKSIPEIVQELKDSSWYTGQIVPDGHRVFEAQEAVYGDLEFLLSQDMVNALYNAKGITQFYAHQAEAINALHEGYHVVVATSTSSGKSLIYQLPVLHALEQDHQTRAMYIFPTKALAQDQRRSLKEMMGFMPGLEEMMVETFDGDTPMNERNAIREEARIIFTNPDMLHITILPNEDSWRTFLKNLKYVVGKSYSHTALHLASQHKLTVQVDELHYYNGLMGSHVAFIMRRLRRTCAALGNRHVKFISCSATVANPEEHFKTIFGIDHVRLVDFDGSPSGKFLHWG